ncbi:MAG: hypothetical protein NT062_27575 [Proteobacteria bacterium]|nr:hypothetical protein [Pseudomonadota bacterium]
MTDAWQMLRAGGLPLAMERGAGQVDAATLARAVREAIAGTPTGRHADALAAFTIAWHQHWPAAFATAFASEARAIRTWADDHRGDPNRFLKLRRIALANLARVL